MSKFAIPFGAVLLAAGVAAAQPASSAALGVPRSAAATASTQPQLAFYAFSQAPPMGWNSCDDFGDTVTEKEVPAEHIVADPQFKNWHKNLSLYK